MRLARPTTLAMPRLPRRSAHHSVPASPASTTANIGTPTLPPSTPYLPRRLWGSPGSRCAMSPLDSMHVSLPDLAPRRGWCTSGAVLHAGQRLLEGTRPGGGIRAWAATDDSDRQRLVWNGCPVSAHQGWGRAQIAISGVKLTPWGAPVLGNDASARAEVSNLHLASRASPFHIGGLAAVEGARLLGGSGPLRLEEIADRVIRR